MLVLDIGARPMGSPAEQRALEFAVAKFDAYGCDTSYVLPMTVAAGVNTKSGVAIGVKKGKSDRIIIIGGHIDSSGPDVPGANDDGSGTACVIELARVLCKRENESTIYFCCWGGEEQGLRGSEFFVENFKHLDSVALMLQIDMADGSGVLHADPDGSKRSAPSWLVKSAFDVFYNELPHEGLVYPTEEATLNLAAGGAFGSDHIPFIDKGIPAIDFTSDPTFPIHTPQDNWENFTPSGLQRSGDLILKLFERFDGGVPSRSTEQYQLVQIGKNVFFLPYTLLWTFIGISIVSLVAAFIVARQRRLTVLPEAKVKWSRLKLFVATIIIQSFIWSSETIIGLLRGYRFPWVNNVLGFKILGVCFGLMGLWFVLNALRKYRLSEDAYVFAPLSLIPLLLFTVLISLITPELGMFFAAASLSFSVAVVGRKPSFKLLFFVLSVLIVYGLIFFDGLTLFQRLIAMNQLSKAWQKSLMHVTFILAFSLVSLPFVHGFAAVYRGAGIDLLWLKRFRKRSGLMVASIATVCVATYLCLQPVYDQLWFNNVRVEHQHMIGEDSVSLTIKGSEYLSGLHGTISGRDTLFTVRSNYATLIPAEVVPASWSKVRRQLGGTTKTSDTTWKVERMLEIHSQFRPLRVDVVFESDTPFEVASAWANGGRSPSPAGRETDRRKRFTWYTFPDTHLVIPITFAVSDTQDITEEVKIQFDSLAFPLRLHREFTNISYRTTLTARDTFSVKPESQYLAGRR